MVLYNSEQLDAFEQQPEESPMISDIDGLAAAVEERRAKNKAEGRLEGPDRTIDFVLKEKGVPTSDFSDVSKQVMQKLSDKLLSRLPKGRAPRKEPHPRGWLGDLEERQG